MVEDSTIANNRADGVGGGIGSFGESGVPSAHSTIELDAVTVAYNVANEGRCRCAGGGLYEGAGNVISARNTIVALNSLASGGTAGRDCDSFASEGLHSLGHNLIGDRIGCAGFGVAGDLFGGPLRLGRLADNGGPTRTIALMRGSRAIDRGDPTAPPGVVLVDQRGVKRDKKPDIGAYERTRKRA